MADTSTKPGSVGWLGVGYPVNLPTATTRLPRRFDYRRDTVMGKLDRSRSGRLQAVRCRVGRESVRTVEICFRCLLAIFSVDRQVGFARRRSARSTTAPTRSNALSWHAPCPTAAATDRAKYVPDVAATDGVQRGATGTPIVTSRRTHRPVISGQGRLCWCGGSRIRTLEGISRRIYSPLRYISGDPPGDGGPT
jgi:hypothetical protein